MRKKNKSKNKPVKNHESAAPDPSSSGGRRLTAVDYKKFVRIWREASSVGEAATQLGIKNTSASAIANRLRRAGVVDLKRFPRRGSQPIDVRTLNKIAAGKD